MYFYLKTQLTQHLSIGAINEMLADGRLIRHRLRKDKKCEKIMINIAAMTIDALSDCNLTMYPLNKPVLLTDILTASSKAGESCTLARSLDAIAD